MIIKINSKTSDNKKRNLLIENKISKILKTEIKLFKIQKLNLMDIKEWIEKSIRYTYHYSFQIYNYSHQKAFKKLLEIFLEESKKKQIEIDEIQNKTVKYNYSKKYLSNKNQNFKPIKNPEKIQIISKNISIIETMSLIDKIQVQRILIKGKNIIEI